LKNQFLVQTVVGKIRTRTHVPTFPTSGHSSGLCSYAGLVTY